MHVKIIYKVYFKCYLFSFWIFFKYFYFSFRYYMTKKKQNAQSVTIICLIKILNQEKIKKLISNNIINQNIHCNPNPHPLHHFI